MSGPGRRRLGWLALGLAALLFSAGFSLAAPLGGWTNEIFGKPAWGESDPGSFYVASAHELEWGSAPVFVGHPGATLTPLLLGVQAALYAASGDEGVSFTHFTVRHLPRVFLASKLLMTLLHGVSWLALYALARRVLCDRRAASFAVLGYATSLPALYYLSRISVEPLMVGFFAAAFLAGWRHQALLEEGRSGAALGWAALAGAAAVGGALTKLAFLGPLPFVLALHVALAGGRALPARWRIASLGAFAAAGGAVFALLSQIIGWKEFVTFWSNLAGLPQRWAVLRPDEFGVGAIFVLSELPFVACALVGLARFLQRDGAARARALWLVAYAGYALLLFAYRVWLMGDFTPFHYFFLPQAVLAIFFGHLTARLARRIPAWASGWRGAVLGALWIAALHGLAVGAVVDSRRRDVREYAQVEPVLRLAARLEPGEGIAIERPRAAISRRVQQACGMALPLMRHAALAEGFAGLFVSVPLRSTRALDSHAFVPALGADVAIVPASQPTRP